MNICVVIVLVVGWFALATFIKMGTRDSWRTVFKILGACTAIAAVIMGIIFALEPFVTNCPLC